jgi:EpsI family protein
MMFTRRDMLMGGGMLAAAAAAAALTPRGRLNLLEPKKMAEIIPTKIGSWTDTPTNGVVMPKEKGSLSDQLYSQTVSRLYISPTQIPVMLVIAYGDLQSDLLQLHRPEVCYAAVGFQISSSQETEVALGGGAMLPARELSATSDSRIEPILYWTRIGDYLPTSGREQRLAKLRLAMGGVVADGALVRLSTVGEPTPETFAALHEFARAMIEATAPGSRPALVGRPLATAMIDGKPSA